MNNDRPIDLREWAKIICGNFRGILPDYPKEAPESAINFMEQELRLAIKRGIEDAKL